MPAVLAGQHSKAKQSSYPYYKKDKNSAVSALLAVKLYIVGKGAAGNCKTKIPYKHLTKEKFFAIISISLF